MPAQKFTIQGHVIDSETRQGLANIEVVTLGVNSAPIGVNATVTDAKDNPFRRTTTDEDGNFTLRFTDLDVINYFDGRPSNLFFKLYRDGFLIENTRETQIWDLTDEISNPISRIVIPVTPTGETFVVRGRVVNSDGSPPNSRSQRFTIRAFNKGIAKTERLGSASLNAQGRYEIEYSRSQLEAGQTRANLLIEVHSFILGLEPINPQPPKPLVTSPLILNANPSETINLALTGKTGVFKGLTEFARVEAEVNPELSTDNLNDLNEQDIVLIAQKTEASEQEVAYYVQARRFQEQTNINATFWYALFSQGSSTDFATIISEGKDTHRTHLEAAIATNIIRPQSKKTINTTIDQIEEIAIDETLRDRDNNNDQPSIRAVLNRTRLTTEKKRTLLRTWTANKGNPQQFWQTLRDREGFQEDEVKEVQRVAQINILSLGHAPMANVLMDSGIDDAKQVAILEVDNLVDLMRDVEPPSEVEGQNLGDRRRKYAEKVLEVAVQSFPTTRLLHKWTRDAEANTNILIAFNRNNPDFEFRESTVKKYLHHHPDALDGISDRNAFVAELEGMGRLFSIIPQDDKFEPLRALWQSDLPNSAFSVAAMGKSAFVRKFEGAIAPEVAKSIHAQARHKATVTTATLMKFSPIFNPITPYAIPNVFKDRELPEDIPDWRTLFGSLDFCECKHCRSIQSPAAYFVDLLQFLDQANAGSRSALDQLLRQRPDLQHIQLNCTNTNTVMPYIDLVNEVLENAVVNGLSLSVENPPQTTAKTEELKANPEHILPEAYEILAGTTTLPTWSLPFDLWHEERQVYLEHLGITVSELMDTFHRPGESPEPIDRATAYLGMPIVKRRIITGETGAHNLGDSDAVLTIMERSQLSYSKLDELLTSRFVNPTEKNIEFDDSCALENATLALNDPERDRLHRFTRLYRSLGWTVIELDQAVAEIGSGNINNEFIIQLAALKRLKERFRLSIPEILSWWGNISTRPYEDEKPLYDQLFLNTTVNNPLDPAATIFGLNSARNEVETVGTHRFLGEDGDLDAEITPLVLAAINLSADELRLLIQEILPNDTVNLDNLSQLYRIASLARALRISIREYLTLTQLTQQFGLTHFDLPSNTIQAATPEETWDFIKLHDRLTASGFNIAELNYLLTHRFSPDFPLPLADDAIAISLAELRTELQKLRAAVPLQELPAGDLKALLTEKLASVFDRVEVAIAIIDSSSELSTDEQQAYIEEQFTSSDNSSTPQAQFTAFLSAEEMIQNLIQGGITDEKARLTFVLEPLTEFLSISLVIQHLSNATGLNTEICEKLLRMYLSDPETESRRAIAIFLDEAFIHSDNDTSDSADFRKVYAVFNRLTKLAVIFTQLNITAAETDFLFDIGNILGWYDLANIPVEETSPLEPSSLMRWLRLVESYHLKQRLFSDNFSLIQLLELINSASASPEEILSTLSQQIGWEFTSLNFLVSSSGYSFTFPGDFLDEQWLIRLEQAFALINKAGTTASHIWQWNTPEPNPGMVLARQIRNASKARYNANQWLEIAPELTDRLRKKRRDALQAFLIASHPELSDADSLYERFLIDSEMNPCFMTSRIKQAISSVQLFIHRVFLGLEQEVHFTREDAEQWTWRKNYRVWEANRKVFLYPENYAEPDLQDDKTPFFEELQEALLQEEVTDAAVEQAYLNYLRRLDEVARLEISGLYVESDDTVHIFARTKGIPPVYYYRRWVDQSYFTPWEKVDISIEGDHLLPVIYNRRLMLLWPTFTAKAVEPSNPKNQEGTPPERYWEIKLSWSEYRNGKWSSPKTSTDFISTRVTSSKPSFKYGNKSRYYFWAEVNRSSLIVYPFYHNFEIISNWKVQDPMQPSGYFQFSGCNENPEVFYRVESKQYFATSFPHRVPWSNFRSYMKFDSGHQMPMTMFSEIEVFGRPTGLLNNEGQINPKDSKVEKILSQNQSRFYITPPHQYLHFKSQDPFFCEDSRRTFFIIPENVHESGSGLKSRKRAPISKVDLVFGNISTLRSSLFPIKKTSMLSNGLDKPVSRNIKEKFFTTEDQGAILNRTQTDANKSLDFSSDEFTEAFLIPSALPDFDPAQDIDIVVKGNFKKKYRFRTFYHPYTCLFIEQLNQFGIEGLLKPSPKGNGLELYRQLTPNPVFRFSATYRPTNSVAFPTPQEDIDFKQDGAYSQYNWELFFHIPLHIANQLSQNQRFEEAQRWYHYIFDPTEIDDDDLDPDEQSRKFWRPKPFYEFQGATTIQDIIRLINEGDLDYEEQVERWEDNPFNPHLVARLRIVSYMKLVVMKYLDNLIAWGDFLFTQDSIESINEATQLYVLASQILDRKPEFVKGKVVNSRSFAELKDSLDALGNASVSPLTELENQVTIDLLSKPLRQNSFTAPANETNGTPDLKTQNSISFQPKEAIVAMAASMKFVAQPPTPDRPSSIPYFCILPNDKLLGYWDIVSDRLFKIRNCQNIEGVTRSLALFQPPIDPALLVKAASAGVDLSSALNDLNAPLPHYRFNYILRMAVELCNDLKSLGNSLLSALEKRDAEEISLLRAGHEVDVLKSVRQMKEKSIEEAKESIITLERSRDLADVRKQYYQSREYKNKSEKTYTSELELSRNLQESAELLNIAASIAYLLPDIKAGVQGGLSSPEVTFSFGGTFLGNVYRAESSVISYLASRHSHAATMASIEAGYQRRRDDWQHQLNLAQKEIEQINQQIVSANIRVAIAESDLNSQELQIQNSQEVFQFMKVKYTNQQLYSWMITQISTIYFQSYQIAYDLAKRAEQCFRYELGLENTNYIEFGYWDSLKKGLLSGERLYKDLKRMEIAYLEQNRREYEITKHISLALLDSVSLLQLRETGACEIILPETLFNLDCPGHYLRRIKSVSLTIPCVTGPYVSINCTLTLLKNSVRSSNTVSGNSVEERAANYPRQEEDPRFRDNIGAIQSIVTSSAQSDSGLFELRISGDERYLPFEGAGVISQWRLELPNEFRQFDYNTITDVILHMNYTAREGGMALRTAATDHVKTVISVATEETPLLRMFSAKHEFPGEWHQFLNPEQEDTSNTLEIDLSKERFPYYFRDSDKDIEISRIDLYLRLREGESTNTLSTVRLTSPDGTTVENQTFGSSELGLPKAELSLLHQVGDLSTWLLEVQEGTLEAIKEMFIICHYTVTSSV